MSDKPGSTDSSPMPLDTPPCAQRRPLHRDAHGDQRVDEWAWLAKRDDPETLAYLEAENEYTDRWLTPLAPLTENLFQEIKERVEETDASAPYWDCGWWYWSRTVEGRQYEAHCRYSDPDRSLTHEQILKIARDEAHLQAIGHPSDTSASDASADGVQVILDENQLAEGHDFFSLGVLDISGDHRLLAYATDTDGSELYSLRFRVLSQTHGSEGNEGGNGLWEELDDVVENVYYGSAWAGDLKTFYYVKTDDSMRPWQVWRHLVGTAADEDTLVFQEDDPRFFVTVTLSHSRKFILIQSESKTSSEAWWLESATPDSEPQVVLRRAEDVEYDVEHAVVPGHGDVWLVRTNQAPDGSRLENFAVYLLGIGKNDPTSMKPLLEHRPDVKVDVVQPFSGHVAIAERQQGLEQIRVIDLATLDNHLVQLPEPVYSLTGGANPLWDTTVVRFGYTSMVTPWSTFEYDMTTRALHVVRQTPVRGYEPSGYKTLRVWAEATDGTLVPISIVARADIEPNGTAPCLIYGYGSYEINMDPSFSVARLNLLERGMVFAIAHIRGGGEMGRHWYEQGRLRQKRNTFGDFLACAEHLMASGWSARGKLIARGGSAGGLLMGAVANMAPENFAGIVAEVPFVDVVTTMSDESLPLTVTEWEEWGNPRDNAEDYLYMKSYSPYDNVEKQGYPAMYVTGGLNDPRVGYWEPAKWVAKLRVNKTDDRPLLFRCEMGAGHQGPSGRYDVWRDEARVQSFILNTVGITA